MQEACYLDRAGEAGNREAPVNGEGQDKRRHRAPVPRPRPQTFRERMTWTESIMVFLSGLSLGLMIILPIGAQSLFVINQGMSSGFFRSSHCAVHKSVRTTRLGGFEAGLRLLLDIRADVRARSIHLKSRRNAGGRR